MKEESQVRQKVFSPSNLGILCHGFELLDFEGKVPATQMNKLLKEQSGLGGSKWRGNISLDVILMVLEKADERCDRTLILKSHITHLCNSWTPRLQVRRHHSHNGTTSDTEFGIDGLIWEFGMTSAN